MNTTLDPALSMPSELTIEELLAEVIASEVPPVAPVTVREFVLLQQWEGTVTERRGDEFVAQLRDLRDPGDPRRMEAVFGFGEVSVDDEHRVVPGAVFTWPSGVRSPREAGFVTSSSSALRPCRCGLVARSRRSRPGRRSFERDSETRLRVETDPP